MRVLPHRLRTSSVHASGATSNVNGLSLASRAIKRQPLHLRAIIMSLEMKLIMGDKSDEKNCSGNAAVRPELGKNIEVQFVLSLAIGVSAFLLFCVCLPLTRLTICFQSYFVWSNQDDTWH